MENKIFDLDRFAAAARRAAAEGVVLLKNDNEVLPLKSGARIALFGRSQYNYYKSGTGSGGMVNTRYVTGVREALLSDKRFMINNKLIEKYDEWIKENPFDAGEGWAGEPWFQSEMPISRETASEAHKDSEYALILIGRTAGEDQDNSNVKGSYLLTDDEEMMIANVTSEFEKTIVLLNVGNIIDMNWVEKYKPAAVAYIWQGGQEGGNGVLDVLSGDVNPSGRLVDSIAYSIDDYPSTENFGDKKRNIQKEDIYVGYRYFETFAMDKVIYPFGFGLSYTDFQITIKDFSFDIADGAKIRVNVKNTGKRAGQEVVELYLKKPQGKLGNPERVLVGFAKTKNIEPGEDRDLEICVPISYMSSYDDTGVTGFKSSYVLEEGKYLIYAGADVRAEENREFILDKTYLTEKLTEAMAPNISFERIKPHTDENGNLSVSYERVEPSEDRQEEHRAEALKELKETEFTGDKGIKLSDVADGKASMDSFIAQLSDEDLASIVRGEGMSSPKVTPGTGGAFGGVTDALMSFGIPVACCTDGPSGIRMDSGKKAFSMPNGTLLACSWNTELMEELYEWEGLELRKNKIDLLLGPGMNIHRNPLNGRNFEYFSEDPLISGKCAAAQLRGMHKYGVTGTIKHFAMNTQEAERNFVEHIASERAIREIYLKGFEIAVKEGNAHAVMTTYGPINGYYTSSNFDLLTTILRGEWGFDGIVMTDWWARGGKTGNGDQKDMASIAAAQNDLFMVTVNAGENSTHDNTLECIKSGRVSRAEYQRNAANICKFIMNKPVFFRLIGRNDELDRKLAKEADDEELIFDELIKCSVENRKKVNINSDLIKTARNNSNLIEVAINEKGNYKLSMELRANTENELAQIPLTIYRDTNPVKMLTLTGADREWQKLQVDFKDCFSGFYIKLYFAQDGIEIKNLEISMD